MGRLAHMRLWLPPSEFLFAERVLVPNVSHENHLIFMRMTVQVTYIFIPIVSLKDSFCHRGKSKLGIGLFIHELLREPLISVCQPTVHVRSSLLVLSIYPLHALWHIGPSQSFFTLLDWLLRSAPPPTTSNLPLAFLSLLYVSKWFLVFPFSFYLLVPSS